jgi:glycosyltransferase involved in cell wall biosynthesis
MKGYFSENPPDENVVLMGHVPQSRLKEVMSQSHVMVLPSLEEGLALVQAQALACGCPVIGTHNTGASDLFSDGVEGFIVPPRDPDAISNRLQQLADEPDLRQKMSRNAIKAVRNIGGWSAYGEKFAAVLDEIRNG